MGQGSGRVRWLTGWWIREAEWDWEGGAGGGETRGLLPSCICQSVWGRRAGHRVKESKGPQAPLALQHLTATTSNEVRAEYGHRSPPLPDSRTRASFPQPHPGPCREVDSKQHSPNHLSQILDPSEPLFPHQ